MMVVTDVVASPNSVSGVEWCGAAFVCGALLLLLRCVLRVVLGSSILVNVQDVPQSVFPHCKLISYDVFCILRFPI